jgi:putative transposase
MLSFLLQGTGPTMKKVLGEIGTSFSSDTIFRWHRQLVAEKWDYSDRREAILAPPIS